MCVSCAISLIILTVSEQCFDLDTVSELEGGIKNGKTNVIKIAVSKALAKHIETGLHKMTAWVAVQMDVLVPAINARHK